MGVPMSGKSASRMRRWARRAWANEEVEVLGGAGHNPLGDERTATGEEESGRLGEGEEEVGQRDL